MKYTYPGHLGYSFVHPMDNILVRAAMITGVVFPFTFSRGCMSTMYYCSNHLCSLKTEMKQPLIQQPQGQQLMLCLFASTPSQYFTIIHLTETALTKPWQKHDTPMHQRAYIPGSGVSVNYLQLSQISLAESCQSTTPDPKMSWVQEFRLFQHTRNQYPPPQWRYTAF